MRNICATPYGCRLSELLISLINIQQVMQYTKIITHLVHSGDASDKRFNPINDVRTYLGVVEIIRDEDENDVVNGLVLVFDFTGLTLKQLQQTYFDKGKITSRIYQVGILCRLIIPEQISKSKCILGQI